MDQESNKSIEELKHKLEAQTEAYVEFNNALVKILELQNQLKADLLNNSNLEVAEIRSIFEKVLVISTLLDVYTKNKTGIGQELDEYNAVLSNFGGELNEFKNDLQAIINAQALNSEIDKFMRKLGEVNSSVRNETTAIKTEIANLKSEQSTHVKNFREATENKLDEISKSQDKFFFRINLIFAGFGGAFVLYQILSSIGMIHFGK
jgi:ABC-type transporter Mla subunit MlaD